ncbi:MAG TPA: hypothetical protein VFZ34_33775 [Blastocatellia bacterium]|nr:hypothetical protein [Blastocatellia bacterium]
MKLRVHRRLRTVFILSLAFVMIGSAAFFSLPWWLISPLPTDSAQLPNADVIVHWMTGPRSRLDHWVADLYRQGKAKKIVCVSIPVSWDVYAADFARQHLIAMGIPAEDISTLHLEQEACAAPNARRLAAHIKSQGWQSALVATGVITAGNRLEKYFQQEGLALSCTYSPQDHAELTTGWWKTHWKIQYLVGNAMEIMLDSLYAECR